MEPVTAEPIRIVYFGTPAYAVPSLRALAADTRVEVSLVVTQPDRPAGRGRKLTPPAVKEAAIEIDIPVYQPERLRTDADRQLILEQHAKLFVVAAFGKIFGPKLLALPSLGCVNLHASNLPDYRGASPISAAILEGNLRTGVTLMAMDVGLDTGPILAQRSIDIEPHDTTASLTPRLAQLGADLLVDSLDELIAGQLSPVEQDDAQATITRPMVKADGWIDWSHSARDIERQIRAMWDWPRAWTTVAGEPLQIHRATVRPAHLDFPPGAVLLGYEGAVVATGNGSLLVELAQVSGGKPQPGHILLGQVAERAEILGAAGAPSIPEISLIRTVELPPDPSRSKDRERS